MMRGGPGLGNIAGAQGDYFQATRGGGNGDYHVVVLAPGTVQELADYTVKAFEIADKYRVVVMLLGDGYLGQMAEPGVLPEEVKNLPAKPWALTGKTADRESHIIASLKLGKDDAYLNRHVKALAENYAEIAKNEVQYENFMCDDADVVLCAYGTSARVCKKAVKLLRDEGIKAGLFRPITLWPFPEDAIEAACAKAKKVLTVEMSMGQMVQDVRLYSGKKKSEHDFYGEPGGIIPKLDVIMEKVKSYV
jgi:2-oxoglutarate ferredoxin oxidoreductase subunit alpha